MTSARSSSPAKKRICFAKKRAVSGQRENIQPGGIEKRCSQTRSETLRGTGSPLHLPCKRRCARESRGFKSSTSANRVHSRHNCAHEKAKRKLRNDRGDRHTGHAAAGRKKDSSRSKYDNGHSHTHYSKQGFSLRPQTFFQERTLRQERLCHDQENRRNDSCAE